MLAKKNELIVGSHGFLLFLAARPGRQRPLRTGTREGEGEGVERGLVDQRVGLWKWPMKGEAVIEGRGRRNVGKAGGGFASFQRT